MDMYIHVHIMCIPGFLTGILVSAKCGNISV